MDLTLKRTYFNDATLGTLSILGKDNPIWHTLELPNLSNIQRESCIPEGCYLVKPYSSDTFVDVWEVQDVPERSKILIHVGNWTSDTDGCILVGLGAGYMHNKGKNEKAIYSSRNAITQLKMITKYPSEFNLYIGS